MGQLFDPMCWKCLQNGHSINLLTFRAGHFRYFLIFSITKNDFFCIFYQAYNLFLHQSYLKSPLPVKLTW